MWKKGNGQWSGVLGKVGSTCYLAMEGAWSVVGLVECGAGMPGG